MESVAHPGGIAAWLSLDGAALLLFCCFALAKLLVGGPDGSAGELRSEQGDSAHACKLARRELSYEAHSDQPACPSLPQTLWRPLRTWPARSTDTRDGEAQPQLRLEQDQHASAVGHEAVQPTVCPPAPLPPGALATVQFVQQQHKRCQQYSSKLLTFKVRDQGTRFCHCS